MTSVDELAESFETKLKVSQYVKPLMDNCDIINERINKEICNDTIKALSDIECLDTYKNSKSLKNKIVGYISHLENNDISEDKRKKMIEEYLPYLIPPGLKGVIRGNKFNQIIKTHILSLNLDKTIYDIQFEKKYLDTTSEIPDWYILEKETQKVMIGMNQLDIWGGGQQFNRGSKYILTFSNNSEKVRLVCVIANKIIFKSNKNKAFKFFQKGFEENTLCYLKNLKNIIIQFFKIKIIK